MRRHRNRTLGCAREDLTSPRRRIGFFGSALLPSQRRSERGLCRRAGTGLAAGARGPLKLQGACHYLFAQSPEQAPTIGGRAIAPYVLLAMTLLGASDRVTRAALSCRHRPFDGGSSFHADFRGLAERENALGVVATDVNPKGIRLAAKPRFSTRPTGFSSSGRLSRRSEHSGLPWLATPGRLSAGRCSL